MTTDNLTRQQRRRTMASVKSRDTGPEMAVRRLVHGLGYRYRLSVCDLPGKPDLTLRRLKKVIFVHGCFWHVHNCPSGAKQPKTNRDYWQRKRDRTQLRDRHNRRKLRQAGWDVLTLWECEIKNHHHLLRTLKSFLEERA